MGYSPSDDDLEGAGLEMDGMLPPGPRYPAIVQGIGFWTRPLPYLERCRARYGPRFTIRLPTAPPFVMLTDPAEVKQVFTAPPDVLRPGQGARVLEPIVGSNSVILLDGDAHMEQRKLMLPAFHGERMERLSGLMAEVTAEEVARLPRGVPVELHPRMQDLTLKIILRAVFGIDPGPRFDALHSRLQAMLSFGDRPLSLAAPEPDTLAHRALAHFPPVARFMRDQRETDALVFELIAERRTDDGERDDVLAMLLAARHEDGSPMSNRELRDELMTLLVAGHETTASELSWAFERLARTPRVAGRLAAEIGSGNGDAYLTATVQETLRRRPVLPQAAPRLVKQPVEIGGFRYPEGVCLAANAYLIHHDPALYSEPYEFRPERFLDEPPGTYSWIPFGGGRRRCLGASFALLEMKVVLRAVLARAEPGAAPGVAEGSRRRSITLSPRRSALTVLRPRSRAPAAAAVGAAAGSA